MTNAHHHHLCTRQSLCDMLCSKHELPISQKTTPSLEPLVYLTSTDQIYTYRRLKGFSLTAITNTTLHQEKEGLDQYKTNILEQWNFGSPRFGLRHTSSTIIQTRKGIKQSYKKFLPETIAVPKPDNSNQAYGCIETLNNNMKTNVSLTNVKTKGNNLIIKQLPNWKFRRKPILLWPKGLHSWV